MKINKTGLCLAIAAALGTTNAYAVAASTYIEGVRIVPKSGATVSPPVYFAKERTLETAGVFANACATSGAAAAPAAAATDTTAPATCVNGGDLNITIPTNPGYAVNATNTMFLKINLLKGAKFGSGAHPTLKCWGSASVVKTGVAAAFQVGGKGTSSVSFSLPQNFKTTADAGLCTLVASAYVSVPSSGLSVSATVVYKDGALTKSASYKGTVISFATGTQLKVLTANSSVTADVGSESKKFTTITKTKSGASTSSTKTAYLGFVKYGQATAVKSPGVYRIATASYKSYTVSAAAIALSSASLVIEGASLAAASKLYLTTAAAAGCGGTKLRSAAGNGTTTITFANMGNNKSSFIGLSAGLNICMEVDGTKGIDQSVITASLGSVVGKTNFKPIVTPLNNANSLATVKQNGTTLRLLNVNSPAMAEKSYVRLYNTGNQPVKVTGSLFTTDGKQVGTNQVIDAALAGLSVKVLDAAALKTLFGDWTGKAMLRLDANSSTFKAMGTIRDATGTLINASGSTKN